MHSNVLSLKQWWSHQSNNQNTEIKVRYIGWDHKTRFLKLLKFDDQADCIIGELDCGKKVRYPSNSRFWVEYDEGMDHEARAI